MLFKNVRIYSNEHIPFAKINSRCNICYHGYYFTTAWNERIVYALFYALVYTWRIRWYSTFKDHKANSGHAFYKWADVVAPAPELNHNLPQQGASIDQYMALNHTLSGSASMME